MREWLKNNAGKTYFKIVITSLCFLILFGLSVFIFFPNTFQQSTVVDFELPDEYNQPLVVKTLDTIFSITPVNAVAAKKVSAGKNKVRYIDVYQQTDVTQEILTNKIKEDIILKSPGHPERFSYLIDLTQVDYKKGIQGNLVFYKKGHVGQELYKLLTIPAPFMIDNQGKQSSISAVGMEMQEDGKLILTPSKEWLAQAKYPVALDPSLEIEILNVHSHPQQGENWEVEFTTQGTADLKIIPDDQATIDDDEFVSLSCDGQIRQPKILANDVIYYPNWSCGGVAKVIHYTLQAGNHTLRFEFGDQVVYAHNDTEPWWNSSFDYRQKVTFDNTDQSTGLENFPTLATSTSANTDFWSHIQDDYRDIRFINDDGNELYFEMEEFDYTNDNMVAWVKMSYVHATVTDDIWMYYGNSGASTSTYATTTGVWDENFIAVHHFEETDIDGGVGDIKDSTSYNNDGRTFNMDGTDSVDAKIGKGFDFDGNNDFVSGFRATQLESTDTWTAEVWFKTNSDDGHLFTKNYDYNDYTLWMGIGSGAFDAHKLSIAYENGTTGLAESNTSVDNNSWHYGVGVRDGSSTLRIFVDDSLEGTDFSTPSGIPDAAYNMEIGVARDDTRSHCYYFDGIIDEVRISDINRSGDWIYFSYCNMMGECTEYASEEIGNSAPTVSLVNDTPDSIGVGAKLDFSVDWNDEDVGDVVKIHICKSSGITTSTQTCKDSGSWINSDVFTNRDPENITYTTSVGDSGTQNYWAFVCDDDNACSDGTAGTFTVANQRPDAPITLLIEGYETGRAINISDTTPEFSAVYKDTHDEGDVAEEYCIEVDTQSDFAGDDMWISDSASCYSGSALGSNISESNRSEDFTYAGTTLSLDGSTYYWRIWFWDGEERSATSSTGWFTVANQDESGEGGVRLKSGRLRGDIRLK